jgi:hypothetical protein
MELDLVRVLKDLQEVQHKVDRIMDTITLMEEEGVV